MLFCGAAACSRPVVGAPRVVPAPSAPEAEAAPAASVPPPPPAVDEPPRAGEVGTGHPLLLRAAAADGGWAVVCQARADTSGDGAIEVTVGSRGELSGDRLQSYLVEGSGPGEAIDAFVAADTSGRRLVFERGGRLILRDSHDQSEIDLSERDAVLGTDQSPFAPHRAARFSQDGRRLLFLRRRAGRDAVIVLDLSTLEETAFDPGAGLLWRAEFDESGEWLVMRVVEADTNGDGRWDWPYGKPGPSDSPCTSPVPSYRVPPVPPDKPSVRVAPARGGAARLVRGFIGAFGAGGLLRRPEDRALFVDRPGAPSELWSASACDGRLLHADPVRGLLLVACASEEGPRELRLVDRDAHLDLGIVVAPFEIDTILGGSPRLVPVYAFPGPGTALVDLETRRTIALALRDRVIATHGAHVLVRRKDALYLGEAGRGLIALGPSEPLSPILEQPPLVFVAPWVIDMARAKVLGQVPGEGLALSSQGAVLVARRAADAHQIALGPLAWVNPAPPDE